MNNSRLLLKLNPDTARLNWLERTNSLLNFHGGMAHVCYEQKTDQHYYGANARDVIDLAMRHTKCTCHPQDNPPVPCPGKRALSECKAMPGGTKRSNRSA